MDEADLHIIALLTLNSRQPLKRLAAEVGLSSPAVAERLRRLEEKGVIYGYTVDVDPVKLGYPLQALVRINPLPGTLRRVEQLILSIPEFVECDRVTGEDCFVGRLYIRSIEDLDIILEPFHELSRTNTSIVKAQPVRRRLPPSF
ncbi:Lrp/AsnC family transcriptional regulator [Pantoea stewartii subsp. indologenes]|uniref:Lrp/AsnC family transcriptional regulator n=1 Tax=Pantoea stewartii TaxID=66269 RepID=UPI003FA491A6